MPDIGYFIVNECTDIPNPVTNGAYCGEISSGVLYKWDGSAWVGITAEPEADNLHEIVAGAPGAGACEVDGQLFFDTTNEQVHYCSDGLGGNTRAFASLGDAYNQMSDGTNASSASGSETFKFEATSALIPTVTAGSPDKVTYVGAYKLWLPAAGCTGTTAGTIWDLPSSNPAVAVCTVGSNTVQGTLDFADGANTLSAQYTWHIPADWTSTISVRFKWFSSVTSGDVVWQLATACVADAETNDPSFNTASTVTDTTKGTTNQTNDASISSLTTTGCAAGELMHLKVSRDPTNGSDSLGGTARLIGIELTYRRGT